MSRASGTDSDSDTGTGSDIYSDSGSESASSTASSAETICGGEFEEHIGEQVKKLLVSCCGLQCSWTSSGLAHVEILLHEDKLTLELARSLLMASQFADAYGIAKTQPTPPGHTPLSADPFDIDEVEADSLMLTVAGEEVQLEVDSEVSYMYSLNAAPEPRPAGFSWVTGPASPSQVASCGGGKYNTYAVLQITSHFTLLPYKLVQLESFLTVLLARYAVRQAATQQAMLSAGAPSPPGPANFPSLLHPSSPAAHRTPQRMLCGSPSDADCQQVTPPGRPQRPTTAAAWEQIASVLQANSMKRAKRQILQLVSVTGVAMPTLASCSGRRIPFVIMRAILTEYKEGLPLLWYLHQHGRVKMFFTPGMAASGAPPMVTVSQVCADAAVPSSNTTALQAPTQRHVTMFEWLPAAVLQLIFDALTGRALAVLACTCRHMRALLSQQRTRSQRLRDLRRGAEVAWFQ